MRWCIHVDTPRLKTGGCRSSSPNAPSNHDFACLVFGSDFRLTFSKQITDYVATIQCDSLCRNCWRRWAVRSWIFATRRRALPRLRLSRLARDRCFCAGRSFYSLARSNRGAGISPPSESTRKLTAEEPYRNRLPLPRVRELWLSAPRTQLPALRTSALRHFP